MAQQYTEIKTRLAFKLNLSLKYAKVKSKSIILKSGSEITALKCLEREKKNEAANDCVRGNELYSFVKICFAKHCDYGKQAQRFIQCCRKSKQTFCSRLYLNTLHGTTCSILCIWSPFRRICLFTRQPWTVQALSATIRTELNWTELVSSSFYATGQSNGDDSYALFLSPSPAHHD